MTDKTEKIKRRNKLLEITAWTLATLILIFAFVYFNFLVKEPDYVSYAEGDRCPDFTISCYTGEDETFNLRSSESKVTVLNFWYTTCGPCVAEIPYFNDLQEKYPEEVKVLIIHRVDPAEGEVIKKIEDMGWNGYKAVFAQDDEVFEFGTVSLYHGLGGPKSNPYPMTVILDEDYRITKIRVGGMNYSDLEKEVLKALNN
ncbi:MAG: TlpA family protein disulfide reductase [Clostridia bacterium]|nr:TlpA family protein disulfide reductase [Clostridia bacterium]